MRHLIRRDREGRTERELEQRLLEGLKSARSRVPVKTFFQRMHALIDRVAAERQRKGRNGKATRSAARR